MSEYILRNEACQRLHEAGGCDAVEEWAKGYDDGIAEAIRIINEMPVADVAPVVHGRWNWTGSVVWWKCSVCECEGYENFKFCPHCGAKMDGSED